MTTILLKCSASISCCLIHLKKIYSLAITRTKFLHIWSSKIFLTCLETGTNYLARSAQLIILVHHFSSTFLNLIYFQIFFDINLLFSYYNWHKCFFQCACEWAHCRVIFCCFDWLKGFFLLAVSLFSWEFDKPMSIEKHMKQQFSSNFEFSKHMSALTISTFVPLLYHVK